MSVDRRERGPDVVVVGSINLDVSVPVEAFPAPGETVVGGDALWSPGGKGANQAVAAARLGRQVAMIGCVGGDAAGDDLVSQLDNNGVDTTMVSQLDAVPTGLATISVAASTGENSIVVSPGANARLTEAMVHAAFDRLDARAADPQATAGSSTGAGCLVQFEVPVEAVAAAVERTLGPVVLNPAPARPTSARLVAEADVVVPNEGELALLAGASPSDDTDALVDQARSLGAAAVVVTLGSKGALVVQAASAEFVPAAAVTAVDTTAAGDSFCAALLDGLLGGQSLVNAARWATTVAAVTVTRRGAQASLPTKAEVDSQL